MNHLTDKKHSFERANEYQEAIEELKKRFCSSAILTWPDSTNKFILDIDCNTRAMGAVLFQKHESGESAHLGRGIDCIISS